MSCSATEPIDGILGLSVRSSAPGLSPSSPPRLALPSPRNTSPTCAIASLCRGCTTRPSPPRSGRTVADRRPAAGDAVVRGRDCRFGFAATRQLGRVRPIWFAAWQGNSDRFEAAGVPCGSGATAPTMTHGVAPAGDDRDRPMGCARVRSTPRHRLDRDGSMGFPSRSAVARDGLNSRQEDSGGRASRARSCRRRAPTAQVAPLRQSL
jgi:hypothetical protein